ncbi:hypothetical protein [Clostridium fessum]|uniref:hypothetical protein n=1 Tax=Clostridium fessum TaxID=2126740 RepID=UPI00399A74D2
MKRRGRRRTEIRLPGVTGDQIAVSNDYVTQTIRVNSQADRTYFDSYPVLGNKDYIDGLSYPGRGDGRDEVTTNKVYGRRNMMCRIFV